MLLLATSAQAEIVTYTYSGFISAITKYDSSLPWPTSVASVLLADGSVSTGLSFQGQFSYDTSTPLQAGPEWGPSYSGAAPSNSASLSFSNSNVSYQSASGAAASELHIYDNNEYIADQFSVLTGAGDRSLQLIFSADNASVLKGSRIPGSLSQFTTSNGFYFGGDTADGNTFTAFGAITTLERVSAVPEPETLAMLFAGLALVGWRQRRKQAC